ncbi:MAG: helix-turn-helix domain-containing protein [Desulfobacterales bacterium]|nr:helix-turn-helix domain-containing protein [Desulfobacterales bacterium]
MPITIRKKSMSDLGKIILYHRKKGNFSRSELSDMSGVGQTAIYEAEHGKTTVRSDTLFRILEALNILVSLDSPFMEDYLRERT